MCDLCTPFWRIYSPGAGAGGGVLLLRLPASEARLGHGRRCPEGSVVSFPGWWCEEAPLSPLRQRLCKAVSQHTNPNLVPGRGHVLDRGMRGAVCVPGTFHWRCHGGRGGGLCMPCTCSHSDAWPFWGSVRIPSPPPHTHSASPFSKLSNT